jgi:hypothetical protein
MSSTHLLNFQIKPDAFVLESYSINIIRVIPLTCATIDISITASNNKIYQRSIQLNGQEYLDWTSDDYLYKYVEDNIDKIFNSST